MGWLLSSFLQIHQFHFAEKTLWRPEQRIPVPAMAAITIGHI
jgi:hypothetical protein